MTNYVVIGNAESRKLIDIDKIPWFKIGCNAIVRYNKVDIVVAVDQYWAEKIKVEYPLITRGPFDCLVMYENGVQSLTNVLNRGWSSGTTAMDFLCKIFTNPGDTMYMIGFDFYYEGKTVNHMYKGLPDCLGLGHPVVTTVNFKTQANQVVIENPKINFVYVCDNYKEDEFLSHPNVNRMAIKEFLEILEDEEKRSESIKN